MTSAARESAAQARQDAAFRSTRLPTYPGGRPQ
jgi:hypothetical protein